VLKSRERVKHLLDGAIESRSEAGRTYFARVILQANFLCTCNGSIMRDVLCAHLKELVLSLTLEELQAWVLDSQVIPSDISPADDAA